MALKKINGLSQFVQMTHEVINSFNSYIPKPPYLPSFKMTSSPVWGWMTAP